MPSFQRLLGDGSQLGLSFSYVVQPRPEGLAGVYPRGGVHRDDAVAMILGDNIFTGTTWSSRYAAGRASGAG